MDCTIRRAHHSVLRRGHRRRAQRRGRRRILSDAPRTHRRRRVAGQRERDVHAGALAGIRVEHVDNSDSRNYRVSFRKIEESLGFHARYTLRTGVEELKDAFTSGLIADYTDLRYHNQRFLLAAGGPGHKNDVDAQVMAAFSGVPLNGHAANLGTALPA